jgi:hypothetical protein
METLISNFCKGVAGSKGERKQARRHGRDWNTSESDSEEEDSDRSDSDSMGVSRTRVCQLGMYDSSSSDSDETGLSDLRSSESDYE